MLQEFTNFFYLFWLNFLSKKTFSYIIQTINKAWEFTYIVYSINVDSCLYKQVGLSVKAMLGNVMESIHILLQTQENMGLNFHTISLNNLLCLLHTYYVTLNEQTIH